MAKSEVRISRRNALLVGGGAAAAIGAIAATPLREAIAEKVVGLVSPQPRPRQVSLATGGYEDWLAQVGTSFSIGGGGALRLQGVRAFASAGPRPAGLGRDRAFVAFFDPVGGSTLAGDLIYTASHAAGGPLQIFLSSSPDATTPARMLAVFN
jgi:hypothetical protein